MPGMVDPVHDDHGAPWRSPAGGPRLGDGVEKWPAERIQAEIDKRLEAEAVAGGELMADGGHVELREGETRDDDSGHASGTLEMLKEHADEVEWPALHVGDRVSDREGDDATLLVVGVPPVTAEIREARGKTVAEWNPEYPADDEVVEVVYPDRTTVDIDALDVYSFPRSRLKLEDEFHDSNEDSRGEE